MSARRDLASTQRTIGAALGQLVPLDERPDLADGLTALVSGNDRLSPIEQAEIYREQYWLRHRDTLYEDYPALAHLLGEDAFEDFLRAYLEACPPDSYTLRNLGNRIADFASSYQGFDASLAAAARDMARYELAFVEVFDGPDIDPVPLERVQGLPPEAWASAQLVFQPRLQVMTFDHPVHELRAAVKKGSSPERHLEARATILALWRGPDLKVRYQTLQALERALLDRLRDGAALAEACDEVAGSVPAAERDAFPARLSGWFRAWAERGWIISVCVGDV